MLTKTLMGALQFFYRFAGRGAVPYGDHRGEGGLGSNGKDGMIAAAMQIASGAEGNPRSMPWPEIIWACPCSSATRSWCSAMATTAAATQSGGE